MPLNRGDLFSEGVKHHFNTAHDLWRLENGLAVIKFDYEIHLHSNDCVWGTTIIGEPESFWFKVALAADCTQHHVQAVAQEDCLYQYI